MASREKLQWEQLPSEYFHVFRLAVPGGWLVKVDDGLTFLRDPEHEWDGAAVDPNVVD